MHHILYCSAALQNSMKEMRKPFSMAVHENVTSLQRVPSGQWRRNFTYGGMT
jgi:hypothetical protein